MYKLSVELSLGISKQKQIENPVRRRSCCFISFDLLLCLRLLMGLRSVFRLIKIDLAVSLFFLSKNLMPCEDLEFERVVTSEGLFFS